MNAVWSIYAKLSRAQDPVQVNQYFPPCRRHRRDLSRRKLCTKFVVARNFGKSGELPEPRPWVTALPKHLRHFRIHAFKVIWILFADDRVSNSYRFAEFNRSREVIRSEFGKRKERRPTTSRTIRGRQPFKTGSGVRPPSRARRIRGNDLFVRLRGVLQVKHEQSGLCLGRGDRYDLDMCRRAPAFEQIP